MSVDTLKRRMAGTLVVLLVLAAGGAWSAGLSRQSGGRLPADRSEPANAASEQSGAVNRRYKILHVMSYHSSWEWTEDLMRGFQDEMTDLEVEYRSMEMDTKRRDSEEWKQSVAREAIRLIDTWKPDLVYTTDDNAQKYVAVHYVNSSIPFVFSGVNAPPEAYGFVGSSNVTGVLEQEHFVETINLLRKLAPHVKKIAVIVDADPTWKGVIAGMKSRIAGDLRDLDFVSWDEVHTFKEYQEKIGRYQKSVDALGLLGVHTFKDTHGDNVPWQEVVRWTTENSTLPDFTFWKDRISYGTLCAVYVSGYQQGRAAGRMARAILKEGRSPASIPMQPTRKGEPIVSLARARKLRLPLMSEILLTAKIVPTFAWQGQAVP